MRTIWCVCLTSVQCTVGNRSPMSTFTNRWRVCLQSNSFGVFSYFNFNRHRILVLCVSYMQTSSVCVQYKYYLYDLRARRICDWCANPPLPPPPKTNESVISTDYSLNTHKPNASVVAWPLIGFWALSICLEKCKMEWYKWYECYEFVLVMHIQTKH